MNSVFEPWSLRYLEGSGLVEYRGCPFGYRDDGRWQFRGRRLSGRARLYPTASYAAATTLVATLHTTTLDLCASVKPIFQSHVLCPLTETDLVRGSLGTMANLNIRPVTYVQATQVWSQLQRKTP